MSYETNQYEIRELIILNFIEWYASEEEDREPLRQSMQLYLQQEIWIELEGMELKQIGQFINLKDDGVADGLELDSETNYLNNKEKNK